MTPARRGDRPIRVSPPFDSDTSLLSFGPDADEAIDHLDDVLADPSFLDDAGGVAVDVAPEPMAPTRPRRRGGDRATNRITRLRIGAAEIDPLDQDEAFESICRMVETPSPSWVVTPNMQHLLLLERLPDFRAIYNLADLVLADGISMILAARLLGVRLPGRTTGADLLPLVCERARWRGWRVYFLGGRPGAAETLVSRWTALDPPLRVAGWSCPRVGFEEDPAHARAVAATVARASPDVLFLGLGTPKQELFLWRHLDRMRVPLSLCTGAAIDFAAGFQRRAPRPLQRAGLEWAWRLALEPNRLWRRYVMEPWPFLRLLMRARKLRTA